MSFKIGDTVIDVYHSYGPMFVCLMFITPPDIIGEKDIRRYGLSNKESDVSIGWGGLSSNYIRISEKKLVPCRILLTERT